MASSRRTSNGRSPLVNQQSQITSFFSKRTSSASPSPSPVLPKSDIKPKLKPNPSPSTASFLDPATPSPPQSKPKKPLLVNGPSLSPVSTPAPDSLKKSYGPEVVDKRIRVYWPVDKAWYEGCIMSFDRISGKHLVQYDDADEELLNLAEEKIELVGEPAKKFRRLRRISMVVDEEEEEKEEKSESGGDDSQDEDWGNNVDKEMAEDVSEDMDLDYVKDDGVESAKKQKETKTRKRKTSEQEDKLDFIKKNKTAGDLNNGVSKSTSDVNVGKVLEPKTYNGSK